MEVVSVAAVAENGVIGEGDRLPWHLPHESQRYRARVADYPVAIGRRTYEMFDEPPGRVQIVLSRTEREWESPTALHAGSVDEALELAAAQQNGDGAEGEDGDGAEGEDGDGDEGEDGDGAEGEDGDVLYVLGGSAIYELFLPVMDRQLLSRVHGEYEGDATYPAFDEDDWVLVDETPFEGYTLEEWVRDG